MNVYTSIHDVTSVEVEPVTLLKCSDGATVHTTRITIRCGTEMAQINLFANEEAALQIKEG